MKRYQFEELIASLSIIIALLSYEFEVWWLFVVFLIKSIFDFYCAIKTAYYEAIKEIKE
jgi:hypothetical protein